MNQLQISKCLGCEEDFAGVGMCPDCARLDAIYESRRLAKRRVLDREERARVKAAMPRIDTGVVEYRREYPHLAPVLAIFLGVVLSTPVCCYLAWHYGRMLIAYLCGAR